MSSRPSHVPQHNWTIVSCESHEHEMLRDNISGIWQKDFAFACFFDATLRALQHAKVLRSRQWAHLMASGIDDRCVWLRWTQADLRHRASLNGFWPLRFSCAKSVRYLTNVHYGRRLLSSPLANVIRFLNVFKIERVRSRYVIDKVTAPLLDSTSCASFIYSLYFFEISRALFVTPYQPYAFV